MRELSLSIKQKYFDQIISGEKKTEQREIRPKNASRYCNFDENGKLIDLIDYDQIKFITGAYVGKRPTATVEVLGAEIVMYKDEKGELVTYIEDGEEYILADVVYTLGDIVSQSVV